jgi:hypothetical protein
MAVNRRRVPQAVVSRELLLTRAAAQRAQLALAVHDLRSGASRPTRLAAAAAQWAWRHARASKGTALAPLAASGAWWLLRRVMRSRLRWLLVAGVAAGAVWSIVRPPAADQRAGADSSEPATDT